MKEKNLSKNNKKNSEGVKELKWIKNNNSKYTKFMKIYLISDTECGSILIQKVVTGKKY